MYAQDGEHEDSDCYHQGNNNFLGLEFQGTSFFDPAEKGPDQHDQQITQIPAHHLLQESYVEESHVRSDDVGCVQESQYNLFPQDNRVGSLSSEPAPHEASNSAEQARKPDKQAWILELILLGGIRGRGVFGGVPK